MSLYPYICKYDKFSVGHPVIHAGDACRETEAILQKEGLIKCTVLPPTRLYHPVLLYRCNKKLLFCLCKSCATQQDFEGECSHEMDAERALTGTWVMNEFRLSVEKGYKVLEIFEAYECDVN